MLHITLVGAGNMGFAMLRAWTKLEGYTYSVVEPNEALLQRAMALGAKALVEPTDGNAGVPIDVLVIAAKPQVVAEAMDRYAPRLSEKGLVVSVAAGVRIEAMASRIDRPVAMIRAMPNTPASIGEGMIVCYPNREAESESHRKIADQLLSATGRVAFVEDEALMDAVTAVSGSGPAYVFHFIEALQAAAMTVGLDHDLALLLAKQTVFGASKLAVESDQSPAQLREQVTSPNGTTAAALGVLMVQTGGLRNLMVEAVTAAKQRSVELGQ